MIRCYPTLENQSDEQRCHDHCLQIGITHKIFDKIALEVIMRMLFNVALITFHMSLFLLVLHFLLENTQTQEKSKGAQAKHAE